MNNFNKINKSDGFTLIEVLIVIGIIAILAAIVVVAINPKKHFDDATSAQRQANVNTILNAVGQYIVDHKGSLPVIPGEINTAFCTTMVPEYVGALPTDPKGNFEGLVIDDGHCNDITASKKVGYSVNSSGDRIKVCSTVAPEICVTR